MSYSTGKLAFIFMLAVLLSYAGAWWVARRYRAVLLARLGQYQKASDEVQQCLESEKNSGATLYAAACIAALSAKVDNRQTSRALLLLRQAFDRDYGRDKAAGDADLDGVRDDPDFPK